jgi:hypothetical protein
MGEQESGVKQSNADENNIYNMLTSIYIMDSNLQTYAELVLEYERVSEELSKLKKECEENTIIQSMNDMKKVYEAQKEKIDKMRDIMDRMGEGQKAVQLMLKIIIKNFNTSTYRRDNVTRYELKTKLEFINEILSECLKTKNELFYISID